MAWDKIIIYDGSPSSGTKAIEPYGQWDSLIPCKRWLRMP
jgi:hypothetical protein